MGVAIAAAVDARHLPYDKHACIYELRMGGNCLTYITRPWLIDDAAPVAVDVILVSEVAADIGDFDLGLNMARRRALTYIYYYVY